DIFLLLFGFNLTCTFAYQTETDSINRITIQGELGFGHQVCNGDFNGDGVDDIVITSVQSTQIAPLKIFIYYGDTSMDTTADLIIIVDTVYDYFDGYSIANAGDVNNDNYDDLIVSSHYFNNDTGKVLLFFGGNPMDAEYDFVLNGNKNYSGFGSSVSTAGDVNGDGISDFLVASSINYNLQIDTSKVFLYFGGSDLDTIPDLIYYSPYIEDSFGSSIASAGDINNDGFNDILIGYKWFSDKVYVYLGAEIVQDSIAFILQNNQIQSNFGSSMCGDNDFNLDGYDDIVIGAPRFDPLGGGAQIGRVYVYLGGQSFNTVADLILSGNEQLGQFGQSISGAGFFNEDNYPDLIINSPFSNNLNGSAYIYFGSSNFDGNADITIYGDYSDQFSFGGTITNCDFNN
ncbi:MAG: integrin alpha, partial [Ignavibacteria bacterium]|nr:integrin alpha [Ignavibacteria bacterium]